MKRPPCIRGLKEFKRGCPQRCWDGETGCPAWIEKTWLRQGGTKTIKIAECLDLYSARLQYDTNVLLEGNQQAVESFRNNMSTADGPKPDPILQKLIQIYGDRLKVEAIVAGARQELLADGSI